jgi:hypothetical protein
VERLASSFRTARALIGWMEENAAASLLKSLRNPTPSPGDLSRVQAAHATVANRSHEPDPKPDIVVRDLPADLADHVARLRKRPAAEPYFGQGWSLGLVDLRNVHALLPTVITDGGSVRIRGASRDDIASIAAITLPAELRTTVLAPGFDPTKNTWTLSSDSPNLRVVGQTAGQLEGAVPGLLSVGFVVAELPSFMQVCLYQNRWFLRDGYHRATSLLRAGIGLAPAFTQRLQRPEELVISNGLPLSAVLGPSPPRLSDYFDDGVSAEVRVPASRKVVVVQALELSVLELPQSAGPAADQT